MIKFSLREVFSIFKYSNIKFLNWLRDYGHYEWFREASQMVSIFKYTIFKLAMRLRTLRVAKRGILDDLNIQFLNWLRIYGHYEFQII